MSRNKTIQAIAIGSALLAAGAPAAGFAQSTSGSSTVTVSVPDVIILDYFSAIKLGLNGTNEKYDHGTYSSSSDLTGGDVTGTTITTLKDASNSALQGGDTNFTLKNVWAIRGFSKSGQASVSISGPSKLTLGGLSTAGTPSIDVTNLKIYLAGSDITGLTTASLNGLQKTGATTGDVQLGLNFGTASVAGDYSGTITITAATY